MPSRIEDTHVTSPLAGLCRVQGLPRPQEGFFTARDGAKLRHASWATPARRRGTAVFLQGRTEFIEKNLETYGLLIEQGFDLHTLDWRGQGLSGREAGDRHKGHIDDFATFLGDLEVFLRGPARLAEATGTKLLLAHSMGGHIALRYLHDHPGTFDRAALSAPMIDLALPGPLRPLLAGAARLLGGLCGSTRYARLRDGYRPVRADPARATIADYKRRFRDFALLTSDARRFRDVERLLQGTPELTLGGPTFGWLRAALASIAALEAPGYPEAIGTPVLIVAAGRDGIVCTAAAERLAARLPDARFHRIETAAHELLMECDDRRHRLFAHLGDFLGVRFALPPADTTDCVCPERAR